MRFEFHIPNKICTKDLIHLLADHEVVRGDEALFSNWHYDKPESDLVQKYQLVLIGFADRKVLKVLVYFGTRLVVVYEHRTFKTLTCGDYVVDLEHNGRVVTEQEIIDSFEGIAICEKWIKGR